MVSNKSNTKKEHKPSIRTIILIAISSLFGLFIATMFSITYLIFSYRINEAMNYQSSEISSQIMYNYENYIQTIIDISNVIQTEFGNTDVSSDLETVNEYLDLIIRFRSEINSISLYDVNGTLTISSSSSGVISQIDVNEQWFNTAIFDRTIHHFSSPFEVDGNYQMIISKYVTLNKGNNVGVLKILISFTRFIDLVSKSNLGDKGHISIINSDYEFIYTSKKDDTISDLEELSIYKTVVFGSTSRRILQTDFAINIETLTNTTWRMGVFIDSSLFFNITWTHLITSLSTSIIFFLLAMIIFWAVSNKIVQPIRELENHMKVIQRNDDFKIQDISIKANKEVDSLSKSFNLMMHKIDQLLNKIVQEQHEQRKSEFKALQHQINPHFLYNTLDSIIYMFDTGQNKKGSELVLSLSKLFRISISKGRSIVTIKEELEHAESYLKIQSIRYKDAFDYSINCDNELLDEMTPKLILQPLIENSIYHGLKHNIDKGHISIDVKSDDDSIYFIVSDNGYGIKQEKIDEINKMIKSESIYDSVGMKNIYQRLKLLFNGKADLEIKSVLDEGTTITITIPRRVENESI